jgi:hypothetical protein
MVVQRGREDCDYLGKHLEKSLWGEGQLGGSIGRRTQRNHNVIQGLIASNTPEATFGRVDIAVIFQHVLQLK